VERWRSVFDGYVGILRDSKYIHDDDDDDGIIWQNRLIDKQTKIICKEEVGRKLA
jgi:hypothetical protein